MASAGDSVGVKWIAPAELKAMLGDGGELVLLDLREEGRHSEAHLLYAASLPLSRMELRVRQMVPRYATRIVLLDDDDGLAARAAATLRAFGYTDIAALEGGVAAWEAAGYILFSGVHVPSKAFGEFVEHHFDTPRIPAADLQAKLDAGDDIVILDSRPFDEYHNMNIPGGVDVPGAELAYRVHDMAPQPDTLVIVNCAGRTRSIIGAQSLINAGIPNRVMALKDGTMGWHLAGLTLERGASRQFGPLTDTGSTKAQDVRGRVAERFGVTTISMAELDQWREEAAAHSLYILDVRTAEEFAAGHLPDAVHAPGGQLVQETETWVATLGARLVLVDNDRVRATMTASWLRQMGWNAVVLDPPGPDKMTATGPTPMPAFKLDSANSVTASGLQEMLDAPVKPLILDLRISKAYRDGHIPGACFAVRARLAAALEQLSDIPKDCVLVSEDGAVAALACRDLLKAGHGFTNLRVLEGGIAAWIAGGRATEKGTGTMLDTADDVWLKPYDHGQSVEDRMRDYLAWEVDLVDRIEKDGDHRFVNFAESDPKTA